MGAERTGKAEEDEALGLFRFGAAYVVWSPDRKRWITWTYDDQEILETESFQEAKERALAYRGGMHPREDPADLFDQA